MPIVYIDSSVIQTSFGVWISGPLNAKTHARLLYSLVICQSFHSSISRQTPKDVVKRLVCIHQQQHTSSVFKMANRFVLITVFLVMAFDLDWLVPLIWLRMMMHCVKPLFEKRGFQFHCEYVEKIRQWNETLPNFSTTSLGSQSKNSETRIETFIWTNWKLLELIRWLMTAVHHLHVFHIENYSYNWQGMAATSVARWTMRQWRPTASHGFVGSAAWQKTHYSEIGFGVLTFCCLWLNGALRHDCSATRTSRWPTPFTFSTSRLWCLHAYQGLCVGQGAMPGPPDCVPRG